LPTFANPRSWCLTKGECRQMNDQRPALTSNVVQAALTRSKLLGSGVATSGLTNACFDSRLSTVGTGRSWATAQKLLEMMHG
jgi:hypothetical protein